MHPDQTALAETPYSFFSQYHIPDGPLSKLQACPHSPPVPPPGQTHQAPSYQEGENPESADQLSPAQAYVTPACLILPATPCMASHHAISSTEDFQSIHHLQQSPRFFALSPPSDSVL